MLSHTQIPSELELFIVRAAGGATPAHSAQGGDLDRDLDPKQQVVGRGQGGFDQWKGQAAEEG